MYRILLADDEGIMLESLTSLILKNFPGECEIECAKSGRAVIEISERFRPDIAFMDMQMPGINGIQAMQEIRKKNDFTIFIVVTAYDKFAFAKEAINVGVLEYLTKPVNHKVIVDVLMKAMKMVDSSRLKTSDNLRILEKMEAVVPIIENGFIYSLILEDDFSEQSEKYKDLLDIKDDFAQMMIVEWGDEVVDGHLTNPVGAGVKTHNYYDAFRDTIKDFFVCIPGAMMSNKLIVYIPRSTKSSDVADRSAMIEKSLHMIRKLKSIVNLRFRVGIGSTKTMRRSSESYKEATRALRYGDRTVSHFDDLSLNFEYEESYPIEMERALFDFVRLGDVRSAREEAKNFFDWMVANYPDCQMEIKLKAMEFVLAAEKMAFDSGGLTYYFHYRKEYLGEVLSMDSYDQLKSWFIYKIECVCSNINPAKKDQHNGIIEKAKEYMNANFNKNFSLDDVARSVNISPYYFSKLFKDKTGKNFVEYLTIIRMNAARQLLQNHMLSIKEVCIESGYFDPNYFSRIFKKQFGVTPTEFRENLR